LFVLIYKQDGTAHKYTYTSIKAYRLKDIGHEIYLRMDYSHCSRARNLSERETRRTPNFMAYSTIHA